MKPEQEPFFCKRTLLNLILGILGLIGLAITFVFLWDSPGLTIENPGSPPTDVSGFGKGVLLTLYLAYLTIITLIIWDDKPQ